VRKVFVQLHREGLIYRDKKLVNWDPQFQTAISDLEVEQREVDGHFWHLRYPLADGVTYDHPLTDDEGNVTGHETRNYIVVATTRPETMLGDSGVAVHPDDERYAGLVGKYVELPIVGRRIPIVADQHADPSKGSGAVKITPAHDFNDFEVGERAGLEKINILTDIASIISGEEADTIAIPARYQGTDRFEARTLVVEEFEKLGLLQEIEAKKIEQPFGDRSGVVIEPYLTDQWFCDAETLAQPAIAAVREGKTRFIPENWSKTYFNWMENIQPWCVSRQLWWGHRIPAWYGPDGEVFVAETEEEALEQARARHGYSVELVQDEDVLDTWFSSALWPFSTMGWLDETPDLAEFYPTSVLITAFDIIFFWVARMMMQGIHFMGDVPFPDVYMHALVRDEHGQKMSKSKGNVIDPLELVDELGADALRFSLTAMAAQGRDIKLSKSRIEGYRNFHTKVWNAARFLGMNGVKQTADFDPVGARLSVNRWILSELKNTISQVEDGLENYRFNEAADAVYRFAWHTYCDWYVELIKPLLNEDASADDRAETAATAAFVLDQLLGLLHPFSPFITEEIWQVTGEEAGGRAQHLITTRWPQAGDLPADEEARADINALIELITAIRSARAEVNVPPAAKAPLLVLAPDAALQAQLDRYLPTLQRMARVEGVQAVDAMPRDGLQIRATGADFAIALGSLIDLGAEMSRLDKELTKLEGEITRLEKKLGNERFVANAPDDVVEAERAKLAGYGEERDAVRAARERLAAAV
jgi:valyl-tRNA synthetase